MNLNFEIIAAHVSDYIKNENFFDTFEIEDIKRIMKYSHLTADPVSYTHLTLPTTERV